MDAAEGIPLSRKGKRCQVVIHNGNRRLLPSTMSAPDASAEQHEPAPVSGPNATPSVANVPISPPTETPEQNETDPAVAPLVAMFPDFDPAVLEAVYLSNNKDQNAAIEALLGMSNPEVSHPKCCGYVDLNQSLCSISHLLSRYIHPIYIYLELSSRSPHRYNPMPMSSWLGNSRKRNSHRPEKPMLKPMLGVVKGSRSLSSRSLSSMSLSSRQVALQAQGRCRQPQEVMSTSRNNSVNSQKVSSNA